MPLYKGTVGRCESSNSRDISLLSVVGKLYGRVLIKRVRTGTECAIGEEQCGFRQGRGCMGQMFAVRLVCEKHTANWKDHSHLHSHLKDISISFFHLTDHSHLKDHYHHSLTSFRIRTHALLSIL